MEAYETSVQTRTGFCKTRKSCRIQGTVSSKSFKLSGMEDQHGPSRLRLERYGFVDDGYSFMSVWFLL